MAGAQPLANLLQCARKDPVDIRHVSERVCHGIIRSDGDDLPGEGAGFGADDPKGTEDLHFVHLSRAGNAGPDLHNLDGLTCTCESEGCR